MNGGAFFWSTLLWMVGLCGLDCCKVIIMPDLNLHTVGYLIISLIYLIFAIK